MRSYHRFTDNAAGQIDELATWRSKKLVQLPNPVGLSWIIGSEKDLSTPWLRANETSHWISSCADGLQN